MPKLILRTDTDDNAVVAEMNTAITLTGEERIAFLFRLIAVSRMLNGGRPLKLPNPDARVVVKSKKAHGYI